MNAHIIICESKSDFDKLIEWNILLSIRPSTFSIFKFSNSFQESGRTFATLCLRAKETRPKPKFENLENYWYKHSFIWTYGPKFKQLKTLYSGPWTTNKYPTSIYGRALYKNLKSVYGNTLYEKWSEKLSDPNHFDWVKTRQCTGFH